MAAAGLVRGGGAWLPAEREAAACRGPGVAAVCSRGGVDAGPPSGSGAIRPSVDPARGGGGNEKGPPARGASPVIVSGGTTGPPRLGCRHARRPAGWTRRVLRGTG